MAALPIATSDGPWQVEAGQTAAAEINLKCRKVIALCIASLTSVSAEASALPEPIRAMIETALASKDPATIAAVLSVAKRTVPASTKEIDGIAAGYNNRVTAANAARLRESQARIAAAGPFSLWKGEIELGGGRSTGASDSLSLYGGFKLKRVGLNWTNRIAARIDYEEQSGNATAERWITTYQPRYSLKSNLYAYGVAQYEHDRILGYSRRYTAGAGIGLTVGSDDSLRFEFEAGPSFRHTVYYNLNSQTGIAGRGSVNIEWQPLPTLKLSEESAVYLIHSNPTASSTTSIDTRLFGPLKARLSYDVQYERDVPAGHREFDTISRATLVYEL